MCLTLSQPQCMNKINPCLQLLEEGERKILGPFNATIIRPLVLNYNELAMIEALFDFDLLRGLVHL